MYERFQFERHDNAVAYEKHATAFKVETHNEQEGTFRGVASMFGNVAHGIMPTKFSKGSFKETLADKSTIKLLWQHEAHEPIGKLSATETDLGLEVQAAVAPTTRGKDAMILLRSGVVDEMSIGFTPQKWEMHGKGAEQVRHVTQAKLHEISLVTFAADSKAKVRTVHALAAAGEISTAVQAALASDPRFEQLLEAIGFELHGGKVLSGKNIARLKDAVKFLLDMHVEADNDDAVDFYTGFASGLKRTAVVYVEPEAAGAGAKLAARIAHETRELELRLAETHAVMPAKAETEKAKARSFDEIRAEQKAQEDKWKLESALMQSVRSILADPDVKDGAKPALVGKSVAQFIAAGGKIEQYNCYAAEVGGEQLTDKLVA